MAPQQASRELFQQRTGDTVAMALIRAEVPDIPLSFNNFRD